MKCTRQNEPNEAEMEEKSGVVRMGRKEKEQGEAETMAGEGGA